jgi:hypothetical protein
MTNFSMFTVENIALLIVSSVLLSLKVTALHMTTTSPRRVTSQHTIVRQIPLNNKGMCGGDLAGGMIGPDCKRIKVRLSFFNEFEVYFFFL